MKFHIRRTSGRQYIQPCEEAFRDTYTYVDQRAVDDPAKWPLSHPRGDIRWWYAQGENHRVLDGQITRDFPGREDWFVELRDLDALISFVAQYKTVIVTPPCEDLECSDLEIYDRYG